MTPGVYEATRLTCNLSTTANLIPAVYAGAVSMSTSGTPARLIRGLRGNYLNSNFSANRIIFNRAA